jgi:threonine dehydrogenase-like Zn-dependent dehydrogenase
MEPAMKAVCYYGTEDIRVEHVPDPTILNPRDAIVKITATAICGSDLHIYGGYIPTMQKGDVLGHEFMGEIVEVGKGNARLKVGDREFTVDGWTNFRWAPPLPRGSP